MTHGASLIFLNYLTTVFDEIDDGVVLVTVEPNFEYRLTLANKRLLKLCGYSADAIGKRIADVVTPERFQVLDRHYRKVIASHKPFKTTQWIRLPAGRRSLQAKFIPIVNSMGVCVHIAVIVQDITELARLRETLAAQRQVLDTVV
ncbi:MAG TPA: PAS domain-containing protein [Candidatus Saccharimonadales bacterium]|nr:PAS domain-containing protein [Candidatus Saccharimonadales bacterium]